MQEIFIKKLHEYIRENNPDLLLMLQEENRLADYLQESVASIDGLINQLVTENKPPSVIEEACMEELTRHLKPSRYQYLKNILEEEFPNDYERLFERGLLTTEIINMIAASDPVFDELNFSEQNEDDRHLRYTITGVVFEYFKKEVVSDNK